MSEKTLHEREKLSGVENTRKVMCCALPKILKMAAKRFFYFLSPKEYVLPTHAQYSGHGTAAAVMYSRLLNAVDACSRALLNEVLLLLPDDVETNPGPRDHKGISQLDKVIKIVRRIVLNCWPKFKISRKGKTSQTR